MATDVRTAEKFLAYDGDCPMCIASVDFLVRWGLVRQEQTRANHDLDPLEAELAREAGIRNQLVVIDPTTRETRVGTSGLLWIIGETPGCRLAARLLSLPVLSHLLSAGYQIVSYNRRILSPPAHQIVCDCEPQVTVGRRLTLVVPAVIASVLIAAAWGAGVFVACDLGTAAQGAIVMNVAALIGWLVVAAAGFLIMRGMAGLDYTAHLSVTMLAGALVLLLAVPVVPWLAPPAAAALSILSLMFAFSTMFKMQVRRVKALRLSQAWLWGWTATMLVAFGGTLAIYFRERLL